MMKIQTEAARCLLCENAVCSAACQKGHDPARAVRAVRFDNTYAASEFIDKTDCAACPGECEKVCIHYDTPIRIRKMVSELPTVQKSKKVDLSVDFLGVHFENPFLLSSSIVAGNYEMCANAFKSGWAGAVYKTIGFLKPEEVSPRFDAIGKEGTPFIGFRNMEQISDHELEENLDIIRRLKQDYPEKIMIVSIMGRDEDEWMRLTALSCKAGADIIECNFSCPHMSGHGLGSDVGTHPELVEKYTQAVKKASTVPVLAKMTPNVANMEIPAKAAIGAGADGLAAINTVKSITGIKLESMKPSMAVDNKSSVSGYSGKAVKPIALRFIHDMAICEELKGIPISGMGGIETWHDAAEFIALGCGTVQVTTAVMQYGYRIIDDLVSGLASFMARKGIASVNDMVGMALSGFVSPDELDRKTVVYPNFEREKCVGCGRCFVSCRDAGHQAISRADDGKPILNGAKCVGCHLCSLVCPLGAISQTKRVKKK